MADERYSDPPVSPLKQKYLQTRQIANQKDHLRTKFRDQCLQRAKDMRLQSTFEARMKNARAQQFGTFPQHDNGQEQIRQLVRDEYGQLAIGDNEDDRLSAQDLEDIMAYLSETLQQEERQQGSGRISVSVGIFPGPQVNLTSPLTWGGFVFSFEIKPCLEKPVFAD
jgi:hypothetical protein